MSSPPALDFPSSELDDAEMADGAALPANGNGDQQVEDALFLASPGSARRRAANANAGANATPKSRRGGGSPMETPVRGAVARRALGMSTPRRGPAEQGSNHNSSPILHYPSSSSPAKGRPQNNSSDAAPVPPSDGMQDSDPLHFPS